MILNFENLAKTQDVATRGKVSKERSACNLGGRLHAVLRKILHTQYANLRIKESKSFALPLGDTPI